MNLTCRLLGYIVSFWISICMYEKFQCPQAFTLNSVPPSESEIVAGGIGRNFISRDLLEATSIDDAVSVRSCNVGLQ